MWTLVCTWNGSEKRRRAQWTSVTPQRGVYYDTANKSCWLSGRRRPEFKLLRRKGLTVRWDKSSSLSKRVLGLPTLPWMKEGSQRSWCSRGRVDRTLIEFKFAIYRQVQVVFADCVERPFGNLDSRLNLARRSHASSRRLAIPRLKASSTQNDFVQKVWKRRSSGVFVSSLNCRDLGSAGVENRNRKWNIQHRYCHEWPAMSIHLRCLRDPLEPEAEFTFIGRIHRSNEKEHNGRKRLFGDNIRKKRQQSLRLLPWLAWAWSFDVRCSSRRTAA